MVVTFQPSKRRRRDQHREVGLAAGAGEGRGDVVLAGPRARSRRGSACARPASPGRGPSSRRCAARSTSCRAARCRRSPSRSSRSRASRGSGRCTWSCCRARPRPSGPARSGAPTVCMHGTKSPSAPSTSSTARPMRVMIRMLTATYGDVGQLDADVRDRRAERPHRERHHVHRAAAHAAAEQRAASPVCSSARISAGAIQLLVGPASSWRSAADEGAVLDARDVARVAAAPGSCSGRSSGFSLLEACRRRPAARTGGRTRPASRRTSRRRRLRSAPPCRRTQSISLRWRTEAGGSSAGPCARVGSWRFQYSKEEFGARLHRAAWRQRRVWAR